METHIGGHPKKFEETKQNQPSIQGTPARDLVTSVRPGPWQCLQPGRSSPHVARRGYKPTTKC